MFIDALGLLTDATAFTSTGAVTVNTIDLGATPLRSIGDGEPLAVVWQVDVAAKTSSSDETYYFQAIQSAAEALTTPTIIAGEAYIASGAMISTLLVKGYLVVLPLPPGMPIQQYLGGRLVLGGSSPTITATCWLAPLSMASTKQRTYPKGYVIQ